jgi:hypothetical protein
MSYILFYSNHCPYSAKYIKFLEDSGQTIYFNKVCVDKNNTGKRPAIMYKYSIKEVPSIIVENRLFPGEAAFKWLNTRLQDNGNGSGVSRPPQSMPSRQNKLENNISYEQGNGNSEGVIAFQQGSLDNITDNCKQVGDKDTFNFMAETGELLTDRPSNFALDDSLITTGVNPDLFANDPRMKVHSKKDKLKESQLDNEFSKLQRLREQDTPKSVKRF